MSGDTNSNATGEAVAWALFGPASGHIIDIGSDRNALLQRYGASVELTPLYDHPAPRGRVVLLDKWRVVDTNGRDVYGSFASREDAQFYADGTDFRVMRLALVDADAGEVDRG